MSLDVQLSGFPKEPITLFDYNITHNLTDMAKEANLHQCLWRPEEIDIKIAKDLVQPLKAGLKLLEDDPERFRKFDPYDGWGNYDDLVEFVRLYLLACEQNPESEIWVSR